MVYDVTVAALLAARRDETVDAFNWLHLTDLHWGLTGQKHLWPTIRQKFFESLERSTVGRRNPGTPCCSPATLSRKGRRREFDDLENEVLGPLWEYFRQLGCNPVLLAVPGNHDLQRPVGDTFQALEGAVDLLTNAGRIPEYRGEVLDEREIRTIANSVNKVFAGLSSTGRRRGRTAADADPSTAASCPAISRPHSSPRAATDRRRWTEHHVSPVGLTRSRPAIWRATCASFTKLRDGRMSELDAGRHDVCLLMTHQPPEWLDDPSRKKQYLEINPPGRFAVHLFGHMHEEIDSRTIQSAVGRSAVWQGCSLFGMEDYGIR